MPGLRYRCYAKINLTLEVLGRRADGYHDVASLVHTISLADDLRIEPADTLLTRVEGLDIDPETNLVWRAARLLSSSTRAGLGAELTLHKRIPAAAGLGGGSSDAAAALVGLDTLWGTRVGRAELTRLAAELGSDVPFFVRGGAAVLRGRGDDIEILPPLSGQWFVIMVLAHDVPDKTKRLYGALEQTDFSAGEITAHAADGLRTRRPLREVELTNAFGRAACSIFPGLSTTWSEIQAICGRQFFLSGAGPGVFALAADHADARHQQAKLVHLGLTAFTARTVTHARACAERRSVFNHFAVLRHEVARMRLMLGSAAVTFLIGLVFVAGVLYGVQMARQNDAQDVLVEGVQSPSAALPGPATSVPTSTLQVPPKTEAPVQVLGQDRHLTSGTDVVLLSLDSEDLHQLLQVLALGDTVGFQKLLATTRFFEVPKGTAVHVINFDTLPEGPEIREVRVLEGSHTGDSGWVRAEALVP